MHFYKILDVGFEDEYLKSLKEFMICHKSRLSVRSMSGRSVLFVIVFVSGVKCAVVSYTVTVN